jgi:hypothetical protein
MECYIIYTGYEEFKLAETLKEAIQIHRTNYDNPAEALHCSHIQFEHSDGIRENVDLAPFIKRVDLTGEKLKEIDVLIEKAIKVTEKMLAETFNQTRGPITGWLGVTRETKEWAMKNEIEKASYVWDEEKINELE